MNDLTRYLLGIRQNNNRWNPFLSVFYLTYECDFRCFYCSDGKGTPYYNLDKSASDRDTAIDIVRNIRKHTDRLIITGGEPLLHPDIDGVVREAAALKFSDIILTTNGYYLDDGHLDALAVSLTECVFSIDTLDHEKADMIYKKGPGAFRKIIGNIEQAALRRSKNFNITISSVVTPGNIDDLYDVYTYAQTNGFTYAAAPRLQGVKADKNLAHDRAYVDFFNFLIREKKRGAKIFGTPLYLSYLRDLRNFTCHPFSMLVISPRGDIFYPCLEIGHYAGKIQDAENLDDVRRNAGERFGGIPSCGTQCHSACALSFALLFRYPFSFLPEAFYALRGVLRGRFASLRSK